MIQASSEKSSSAIYEAATAEAVKYRAQVVMIHTQEDREDRQESAAQMSVYISNHSHDLPVVIDTGASFSLTPDIEDFVEPL